MPEKTNYIGNGFFKGTDKPVVIAHSNMCCCSGNVFMDCLLFFTFTLKP